MGGTHTTAASLMSVPLIGVSLIGVSLMGAPLMDVSHEHVSHGRVSHGRASCRCVSHGHVFHRRVSYRAYIPISVSLMSIHLIGVPLIRRTCHKHASYLIDRRNG